MDILEIILISLALSMDACAITIANCTTYGKTLNRKKEFYMPVAFGVFQGVMPLIGFLVGSLFLGFLSKISDYLTASVFFVLAVKITYDLIKGQCPKRDEKPHGVVCKKNQLSLSIVLLQALATSIDALLVGVTFINLKFSVYLAAGIIAIITFVLVCLAVLLGKRLGKLFGEYAEWVGAFILFALAIKSLVVAII